MRLLLLSGAPHFGGSVLADEVAGLVRAGHEVSYVCWAAPSQALVDSVTTAVVLGPDPAGGEGRRAPAPPRSQVERRLRQVRTVLRRHPSRLWGAVRRSAEVRRLAAEADALVAVDPHATLALWHLARQNPRPKAYANLGAAVTMLGTST